MKRKGNISPEVHGDSKWCGAVRAYLGRDHREVGGN